MRNFEVLILLASVTGIKSGYDNNYGQAESALNNLPFFIHPAALAQMIHRLSSGGGGGASAIEVQQAPSNTDGMTTYVTTGSKMHDSKDFPSQPQLYSSGNFVPSEHLNGIHQQQHQHHQLQQQQQQHHHHEASLKSSRNSPISHTSGPVAEFHPNTNAYSVQLQTSNDEHFVPSSYGHHSEHENNAVSLADGYSMNVGHHHQQAHVHDNNQQIQQFLYENRIENHHTANHDGHSILGGNEVDKYHEASTNNIVIPYSGHYNNNNNNNHNYVNHIHSQLIHAKSEAIPISKHVEITKTIPIPIFKQIHIPYPRPVKVQIPNPILVPVSQPYPIQIPIAKPYAVPMVQEIKIPIEKIIPYPIEKKVPYTIEKHVPYPIEKHIAVAIPHPVPFKFPVVRTVLHKVKSHGWN